MLFLIAAVILIGALCTLDLVLTLGVVKRLREHTEMLAKASGPSVISVGEEIGDFTAATVDDEPLSRELLGHDTIVAFFSPSCRPCQEKLPAFVEYARGLPGGRAQGLAVVAGDADEAAAFVAELGPVVRVVVEGAEGPVGTAFQVNAYPTVLRVSPDDAGRIVVTANQVALDRPTTMAA